MQVTHMRLHVHTYGDGEPIVCLHGVMGHGERYARLAERLPGRRVVAPDLRGHGRSTYDPPWTTEQHVADVLDTVAAEERFDLVGFSFGGRIAAALTAAAPERVERLVLLDPALHVPPGIARQKADTALEDEVVPDVDAFVAAEADLYSTPREYLEEEWAQHYVDGRSRVHRPMAVTAWSEMARPAPPRADVPALLVTGARSWLAVDVAALAPEEHVEVPGGHSVLWDDLERTAEAVARFLS